MAKLHPNLNACINCARARGITISSESGTGSFTRQNKRQLPLVNAGGLARWPDSFCQMSKKLDGMENGFGTLSAFPIPQRRQIAPEHQLALSMTVRNLRLIVMLFSFIALSTAGVKSLAADFVVSTPNCQNSWTINGSAANPTLTLVRGRTYTFAVSSCAQHPFTIGYTVFGAVPPGVTGQNTTSGTITYVVPTNAVNCLYFCNKHGFSGRIVMVDPPVPVANFSASPTGGVVPVTVSFSNLSSNATSYAWDFGDGSTSSAANPTHTYTTIGSYTVKLTATGSLGTNVLSRPNYIVITATVPLAASFSASPTLGVAPLPVVFSNQSSGATTYLWAFGDGTTSSAVSPTHTYASPGSFTVTLTAIGSTGSTVLTRTNYVVLTSPSTVVANFTAAPVSGAAPLSVVFRNQSNGATTYFWDFGDGTSSSAADPSHTYTTSGVYTVKLTASAGGGNNTVTRADYIVVTDPPPVITYNPLTIPPTLSGSSFNLWLSETNKQFWDAGAAPLPILAHGAPTTTYGYNGMQFWGPTLIMTNGDFVQINVTNNLIDSTTVHWHGFHIPAIMDGGPHQFIPAGTVWSPSFKVLNSAATYWYHPHLHTTTQRQLTYGAGGFIIVRDAAEAALALPRTYGVDDIPIGFTSRRFLTNSFHGVAPGNQFAFDHLLDNYGDFILANGTYLPQATLPRQYVRLRILNAEIMRGYNLGFSDDRTFYVIANDQGLLDAPVPVTRVKLMVGERVEILLNLGADASGSTLDLKAYNSGQVFGFPGNEGDPVTPNGESGPIKASLLNNTDFNLLHIVVTNATANAIVYLPQTLVTNTYLTTNDVTNVRSISLTGGDVGAEYTFNDAAYSPTFLNHTIDLNAIEQWNITGSTVFGHALHIHDIKFKIVSRSGGTQVSTNGLPAPYESGWKDTVYVPVEENVSVIAKYDDFASNLNPFMFHCHFLNHEDGGMMGQFVVVNHEVEDLAIASFVRGPANEKIVMNFKATSGTTYTLQFSSDLTQSSWRDIASVTSNGSSVTYTETDPVRLAATPGFYRVKIPAITQ